MGSKKMTILAIACLILFQGCETLKGGVGGAIGGAKDGAEKDWKVIRDLDENINENLW